MNKHRQEKIKIACHGQSLLMCYLFILADILFLLPFSLVVSTTPLFINTTLPRSGMQTRRRQTQAAKAELDTREESHTASSEDQVMRDDTIAESTKDEPMEEAVASVPELPVTPVTPVKTRRRLSESKLAAASPKRVKAKAAGAGSSPSSMLQRYSRLMEIPHSAILTQVVWVFDDKYQWWPGKVGTHRSEEKNLFVFLSLNRVFSTF